MNYTTSRYHITSQGTGGKISLAEKNTIDYNNVKLQVTSDLPFYLPQPLMNYFLRMRYFYLFLYAYLICLFLNCIITILNHCCHVFSLSI